MERMSWTDERLHERFAATDLRFDRVDTELLELRREMRDGFSEVRAEMREGFAEMRAVMNRVGAGVIIGLVGVIAAIFAAN
jgi:hypothetical protein